MQVEDNIVGEEYKSRSVEERILCMGWVVVVVVLMCRC